MSSAIAFPASTGATSNSVVPLGFSVSDTTVGALLLE